MEAHNGGLRYLAQQVVSGDPSTQLAKRGLYNQHWDTISASGGGVPGSLPNQGLAGIWACITGHDVRPSAMPVIQYGASPFGQVPMVMGAYIICKKETMEAIAKGELMIRKTTLIFIQASIGLKPRVWIDYSFQQGVSRNKTRHYTGNSWNNAAGGAALITPVTEFRHGYTFCGMPLNINWRGSRSSPLEILTNPGGGTDLPVGFADSQILMTQIIMEIVSKDIIVLLQVIENGLLVGQVLMGVPYVNGMYNNTLTSVHFQQKETGDSFLGGDSIIADGLTFTLTIFGSIWIDVEKATLLNRSDGALFVPQPGDHIRVLYSSKCFSFYKLHLFHDTVRFGCCC